MECGDVPLCRHITMPIISDENLFNFYLDKFLNQSRHFYGDDAKNYRPITIENQFRHSYKTYCLLVRESCRKTNIKKTKVIAGNGHASAARGT